MGKKDMTGRTFFSDRERFAELINVHLYHGEKILLPENLVQRKCGYSSLAAAYGEKNRDILMEDTRQKIHYGIELETEADYSMPERIMVYDACEYEYQIREIYGKHHKEKEFKNYCEKKSRMKQSDFLNPAITVVLYLGDGHWEGKRRLSEMFGISGNGGRLAQNHIREYDFPLLEADFLDPEVYQTDMKEFFQAMQCRREREELRGLLRSESFQGLSPETELAIASHLNVKRLVRKMEKEELPMCKAFDDLMREERQNGKKEGIEKGIEKGLVKGIKKGKREERLGIIRRMKKEGMDKEQIIRVTKCTKKEYAAALGI